MRFVDLKHIPQCMRCKQYFTTEKKLAQHLAKLKAAGDYFHFPPEKQADPA